MNWRRIGVWTAKIALASLILGLGYLWMGPFEPVFASGSAFAVVGYFIQFLLVGVAVVGVFFFDIVSGVGSRVSNLIMPEVGDVKLHPQYSIPEARVCEGKYEEAIAEFRKVWVDYPNDVNAHVRIAELQCQHFLHYDEAVRELRDALAKKCKPEAWAFIANRLVDVQVDYLHDFVGARETLQQIILKFPSSKYAESARARVMALNDKEEHDKRPPRPPLKVPENRDEGTS